MSFICPIGCGALYPTSSSHPGIFWRNLVKRIAKSLMPCVDIHSHNQDEIHPIWLWDSLHLKQYPSRYLCPSIQFAHNLPRTWHSPACQWHHVSFLPDKTPSRHHGCIFIYISWLLVPQGWANIWIILQPCQLGSHSTNMVCAGRSPICWQLSSKNLNITWTDCNGASF